MSLKDRVSVNTRYFWSNLLFTAVTYFSILTVLTQLLIPARVKGDSMYPTIKNNSIVICSKIPNIQRGSVVSAVSNRGKNVIKRVVALDGDKVEVINNKLCVNGVIICECTKNTVISAKVLKKEVFLLGDNIEVSLDSRVYGLVPLKNIKAVVLFK